MIYQFKRIGTDERIKTSWSLTFYQVLERFMVDRQLYDGQLYLTRWSQDNEPFELVLEDFFRDSIKGRLESPEELNHLINALVIALEGGDPTEALAADPVELYKRYQEETAFAPELGDISPRETIDLGDITIFKTNYEKIIEAGVGAAVVCIVSVMGDPQGTRAVVYETYKMGGDPTGVSLLSESGKDWGGFSKKDIETTLLAVGQVDLDYQFTTSTQLAIDRQDGKFKPAIESLRLLRSDPEARTDNGGKLY